MNLERMAWIDLETTGLQEVRGEILECGIMITDRNLAEISRISWVFYGHDGMFRLPDDAKALDMHSKSGLLAECRRSSIHPEDAQDAILDYLRDMGAMGSPMCGAGVGFERRWLPVHMPRVHAAFHYRNYDATHYRIELARLGIPCPEKRECHRAIEDIEDAIGLARLGSLYLEHGAKRK
jgi:oligoribonuclease